MNVGPYPVVAIGTLSGSLPTGVTTAAGPLPGANGVPAGEPVGLNQDNALKGVKLNPFPAMQINSNGSALSFSPAQLSFLQASFEQQSADATSSQSNILPGTTPSTSNG